MSPIKNIIFFPEKLVCFQLNIMIMSFFKVKFSLVLYLLKKVIKPIDIYILLLQSIKLNRNNNCKCSFVSTNICLSFFNPMNRIKNQQKNQQLQLFRFFYNFVIRWISKMIHLNKYMIIRYNKKNISKTIFIWLTS